MGDTPGGWKTAALILLLAVMIPMTSASTDEKVVVVGLDGASHGFMQECMEERGLSNIRSLSSTSFEEMDGTLPPLTPSTMASFLTGSDPGDHGIYGFEKRGALSYDTNTVNSRHLDRILPQEVNGSSVLINVPMTYPAPEIDGVVVSGFPGSTSGTYVYPPTLKSELEERDYRVTTAGTFDSQEQLETEVFAAFEKRRDLSLDFMERYDWDFFMVMFTGDARLMHFESPDCEGPVAEFYERVDGFVGEVMERTDDNTTVILMSNHGFQELDKKMYMYTFLKENGYLKPKPVLYAKHMLQDLAGKVTELLGLSQGGEAAARASFSSAYMDEVEWSGTEAYTGAFYNGQVFVNVDGREPEGGVPEEEYEDVVSSIIEDFKGLRDPESGERVVENVYRKEDIYDGGKMDEVPDIVVEMPGYNHIARFGFWNTFLRDPVEKSSPVKEGFVMSNREITGGNHSIIDLSTSIAATLGSDFGEGEDFFRR